MAVRDMLRGTSFDSVEVTIITLSYEEVLRRLGIERGADPAKDEIVAQEILSIAKSHGADHERIVEIALKKL